MLKLQKKNMLGMLHRPTIDEIDNLISQNEVSLENFEVEDDQRSPEMNAACF